MIYMKKFYLLDDFQEHYAYDERRIHNNTYPLHIFPDKNLKTITFKDMTIFYGGNGSGKSTLLNIIASKLEAERKNPIEKGAFFDNYVQRTSYDMGLTPVEIKAITSDDVFDYLLDVRSINTGIHRRKEDLSQEYLQKKFTEYDASIFEYEEVKAAYEAKHKSMSKFIRTRLMNNTIVEQSNGESALLFWEREITENAIYILDEPENSLSAENQLKLKNFIEEAVRFYNCQFIISTHSPFLLALKDAIIYDLDSADAEQPKKWTELANVRTYYDFFKEREREFDI